MAEADRPMLRLRITIHGAVQGVGFRPHVYRVAHSIGLTGWIRNTPDGVTIDVEGSCAGLDEFLSRIDTEKPPQASIHTLESVYLDPVGHREFTIAASIGGGAPRAVVLPDIAMCEDCRSEILDPKDRRYRYPFTNCTNCGPRFTIIKSLPYDRARTTMSHFGMCPACRAEYEDPANRRFHAQPNACPACGPHVALWDKTGTVVAEHHDAVSATARAVRDGLVVAVKGLGGFHLVVDATRDGAVERLRSAKHREEKPFATMFPSIELLRDICEVSEAEARLLRGPAAPIVLLRRRDRRTEHEGSSTEHGSCAVSPHVAPGNPRLGVMLPYTPLHFLLMREIGRPIVATSGNVADEPICTDEHEALERLAGLADFFLIHNRPIERHVDDSIARTIEGREQILRRARGYAPLPFDLPVATRPAIAVGAHLKNTVGVCRDGQAWVSQHIGDLETDAAYHAFESAIDSLTTLYDVSPDVIYCDAHPDYLSTRYALRHGGAVVRVQHHLAHVFACMVENGLAAPVAAVSWDGTGYGLDGTVWGGEWFRIGTRQSEHVAAFGRFRLPGGERAIREPRRSCLGVLYALGGNPFEQWGDLPALEAFGDAERGPLLTMLEKGLNSPVTSSAGRLFDAVASLIGIRHVSHFEGQAAMELEFAAGGFDTEATYPFDVVDGSSPSGPPLAVDWSAMIQAIVADLRQGDGPGIIARKFHNTMAEVAVRVAEHLGERSVVLTGGCFQNAELTGKTIALLRARGFRPYWHQRIPPNDGGIALGQLAASGFPELVTATPASEVK